MKGKLHKTLSFTGHLFFTNLLALTLVITIMFVAAVKPSWQNFKKSLSQQEKETALAQLQTISGVLLNETVYDIEKEGRVRNIEILQKNIQKIFLPQNSYLFVFALKEDSVIAHSNRVEVPGDSKLSAQQLKALISPSFPKALTGETVVISYNDTSKKLPASPPFLIAISSLEIDEEPIAIIALINESSAPTTIFGTNKSRIWVIVCFAAAILLITNYYLGRIVSAPITHLANTFDLPKAQNDNHGSRSLQDLSAFTGRDDEIGRPSTALNNIINTLHEQVDNSAKFVADVTHEIKNPIASLQSAVTALSITKNATAKKKLLLVIEHDIRRLDRLVDDISEISRLDNALVKERQTKFNLCEMLAKLCTNMTILAQEKGVNILSDFPMKPCTICGMEDRLAQVFINLISNAISFCEEGDAIRVWVRARGSRILAVVEDTGPGIPEASIPLVFERFYSERPQKDFGNNSGLGLSISRQIVEVHNGAIWAENIRPTGADLLSEPLGARFVVGLPSLG